MELSGDYTRGERMSVKGLCVTGLLLAIVFTILSLAYLVNSIRSYGTWKVPTMLTLIFIVLGIFSGVNLLKHGTSSHSNNENKITKGSSSLVAQNVMQQMDDEQEQSKKENEVLKQLQDSFKSLGTVSFYAQGKDYHVRVTNNDTIKAIQEVLKNPSEANQLGYNKLLSNFNDISNSITKQLGNGYSLSLMNPNNPQQAIYTVKDGHVMVNVITQ